MVPGLSSEEARGEQPLFVTNLSRIGYAPEIDNVVSVRPSICMKAMGSVAGLLHPLITPPSYRTAAWKTFARAQAMA